MLQVTLLSSIIFSISMLILFFCGPVGVLISGAIISTLAILFLVYVLYSRWTSDLIDELIYGPDQAGE